MVKKKFLKKILRKKSRSGKVTKQQQTKMNIFPILTTLAIERVLVVKHLDLDSIYHT